MGKNKQASVICFVPGKVLFFMIKDVMFCFNIAAVPNVMKIRNDMLEVCLFSRSFDNIPSKIDILWPGIKSFVYFSGS